jgi:phosphoribosylformylglycinamidine synthase
MILFFKGKSNLLAVDSHKELSASDIDKLIWLFDEAVLIPGDSVTGIFIGPRKEMITPWSTNAVEITQNMGIEGIFRIEEFFQVDSEHPKYDPMLQVVYKGLDQRIFVINHL